MGYVEDLAAFNDIANLRFSTDILKYVIWYQQK